MYFLITLILGISLFLKDIYQLIFFLNFCQGFYSFIKIFSKNLYYKKIMNEEFKLEEVHPNYVAEIAG